MINLNRRVRIFRKWEKENNGSVGRFIYFLQSWGLLFDILGWCFSFQRKRLEGIKQVNVWGQRVIENGQGDMVDKRVGVKVEVQGREGVRLGEQLEQ